MPLSHRSAGEGRGGAVSYNITKLTHHSTTTVQRYRRYDFKTHERMCYQRLGRVSQASAKLLPLYFVFIPVCVRVCAHKKMAFRLI